MTHRLTTAVATVALSVTVAALFAQQIAEPAEEWLMSAESLGIAEQRRRRGHVISMPRAPRAAQNGRRVLAST